MVEFANVTKEQIKDRLSVSLEATKDLVGDVADTIKLYFDALTERGFTDEQALEIVTKTKVI